MIPRSLLLVALCLSLIGHTPARSEVAVGEVEANMRDCEAGVAQARALAFKFPADDLSRYFAERHLHQALAEAGNGEYDDCLEWVERAAQELREHRHGLRPGERLSIRKADE